MNLNKITNSEQSTDIQMGCEPGVSSSLATEDVESSVRPDVDAVIAECKVELTRQYRNTYKLVFIPIALVTLVAAVVVWLQARNWFDDNLAILTRLDVLLTALIMCLIPILAVPAIGSRRRLGATRKAVRAVAELNDPSAVPTLVDVFRMSEDTRTCEMAREGLAKVLSHPEKAVNVELSTAQRIALRQQAWSLADPPLTKAETINQRLNSSANVSAGRFAFRLAVLNSYMYIGGSEELQTVRALAKLKPIANRPSRVAVTEAATRVLPDVEARAAQQSKSSTLLRPTSQAEASSTLLLPASASTATDTSELLIPIQELTGVHEPINSNRS